MTAAEAAFNIARQALVRAVLDAIAYDYSPDDRDGQYADDRMALAARELARATAALGADERPLGWDFPEPDAQAVPAIPCTDPDCPESDRNGATP